MSDKTHTHRDHMKYLTLIQSITLLHQYQREIRFCLLPAIQRYVDRLLKGDVAPPIKVDDNVVVEGNHRYIAGKVTGKMPETTQGTLSPSQTPNIKPMSSTTVDDFDWGNY